MSAPPAIPPLLRAYPALRERLPFLPVGEIPTPVQKADELGKELGIGELYLKRDDLSDATFGGSKTRKLAFLLGDARRKGCHSVVTFGSVGSNHALATALFGSRNGFRTLLFLVPETPSERVREHLLAELELGAEQRLFDSSVEAMFTARALAASAPEGDSLCVIPTGGTSPLGNAGYVDAAFELRDQVRAGLLPEPDFVYVAMGTMGSAVGLALGLKAVGLKTKVIPVRASNPGTASDDKMIELFRATNEYLRSLDSSFPELSLERGETGIKHSYVGRGYAIPTERGARAMEVFRQHTGLDLEPTYTAKAFAALMDEAPRLRGKVVVFWLTHNTLAIRVKGATVNDLPVQLRRYAAPARGPG